MAKPISAVPNVFQNATSTIPLSQLDADFTSLVNSINDLANANNFAIDIGTANAVVLNFPSGITTTTLTTGLSLEFQSANDNTGAATLLLQVNGSNIGTAKNIVNEDGSALTGAELRANGIYSVIYNGTSWVLAGGGGGGGAEAGGVIYENNTTINANYTITSGKNGMSVGPITIASGVSVTIPTGSRWVIL
jgi:hypothetical protein